MKKKCIYLVGLILLIGNRAEFPHDSDIPATITEGNVCEIRPLYEIAGSDSLFNNVTDIDFSSSGQFLAYVREDRFIVWDTNNQTIFWEIPALSANQVEFGLDRQLIVNMNLRLYVWQDLENINEWREIKYDDGTSILGIDAMRFSESDAEIRMLLATNYEVLRWSFVENRLIRPNNGVPSGYESVYPVSLLNDNGSIAATVQLSGGGVAMIDVETGELMGHISSFGTDSSRISPLTFSPLSNDSNLFINVQDSIGELSSRLFVVALSGNISQEIRYDFDAVWTVGEFSPTGELLVLWNASDSKFYFFAGDYSLPLCSVDAQQGVASLAFSPDGTMLASGGADGTVRLWGIPNN